MKRVLAALAAVTVVALVAFFAGSIPTAAEQKLTDPNAIQVTVDDKNPWTSLKLNNDPNTFRFAVVSDRTGGHRPKIFDRAVKRINLLQPEFVLSVGDLIEGYTNKQETIDAEWKEFGGLVEKFQMPFFYVPGNHDLTNKTLNDDWKARFGRKFYHFVYKNVLFLAVNSEDTKASNVTAEQTEEFKKVLEKYKDVRWTLIFTHKPLWTAPDLEKNGWGPFEKTLEGRKYTVFCGHVHRYQLFTRNGMKYYQLATTGGGSRLRGAAYGEFDQIAWITMKNDGPVIGNVLIDGVYGDELVEPESDEPGVVQRIPPAKPVPVKGTITLDDKPLAGATITFFRNSAKADDPPNYRNAGDAWSDAKGEFTPSSQKAFDGLPEGDYKATVFLADKGAYYTGEIKEKSKLPEAWADAKTTPVKLTVKAGESIKIELKKP